MAVQGVGWEHHQLRVATTALPSGNKKYALGNAGKTGTITHYWIVGSRRLLEGQSYGEFFFALYAAPISYILGPNAYAMEDDDGSGLCHHE